MKNLSNSNLGLLVSFLLILIINLPKVDLFAIPGMRQGIRIDDFIVIIICILSVNLKSGRFFLPKKISILLFYILFSSSLGVMLHPGSDLVRSFYIFRVIEYFAFAIALGNIWWYISTIRIINITIIIQFIAIMIDLFAGKARSSGTLNGPWEVITVVGLLSFYGQYYMGRDKLKYFSIPVLLAILTQSRTAIFAVLASISFSTKSIFKVLPIFITLIGSMTFYVIFLTGPDQFQWIKSALNINNIELFIGFIESAWSNKGSGESIASLDSADPSLAIRFVIWLDLISLYSESQWLILKALFGIGLGSKSIVVDGFYIRLIFELGLVGVFIYVKLMLELWRNTGLRPILVFLTVTCLTLDPYSSSKIAYCLGFIWASSKQLKDTKHNLMRFR